MSDFKELELGTRDLIDEETEERLRSLLQKLTGVHTVRITQSGVHVIYNPLGITPEEITRTFRQAGLAVDYAQVG